MNPTGRWLGHAVQFRRMSVTTRPHHLVTKPARLLFSVAVAIVLGLATSEIHDFDIFWQLQSGRHMVETGEVLRHDTFSLTPDAPRYEHCWLHDLAFYATYSQTGYHGVCVLKGLLVGATMVITALAARARGASWRAILAVVPALMMMTYGAWMERPQLWSFLLFAVFLLVLSRRGRGHRFAVLILGPLMLLWANLHAGAALAFAVVAAYIAGDLVELLLRRPTVRRERLLVLVGALVLLLGAGLATPYGTAFYRKSATTPGLGGVAGATEAATRAGNAETILERSSDYGPARQILNMDWRQTDMGTDTAFFVLLGAAAIVVVLGRKGVTLGDSLLLAGMAFAGTRLSRHTTFFFIAIAAILPSCLDAAAVPLAARIRTEVRRWIQGAVMLTSLVMLIALSLPPLRATGFFRTGLRDWHYPIEAAEFVALHRLPGNIYNTYDWGGFLMWTLFPAYSVFWDGRGGSAEMFNRGFRVMSGLPDWQEILARHSVNSIVTKACSVATGQHYPLIDRLRNSPKWALVFADESALVFVRADSVPREWLNEYRLPESRIDATILAEASLLVGMDPSRFAAWWEIGRIHFERQNYAGAIPALRRHLALAPVRNIPAEVYLQLSLAKLHEQAVSGR